MEDVGVNKPFLWRLDGAPDKASVSLVPKSLVVTWCSRMYIHEGGHLDMFLLLRALRPSWGASPTACVIVAWTCDLLCFRMILKTATAVMAVETVKYIDDIGMSNIHKA